VKLYGEDSVSGTSSMSGQTSADSQSVVTLSTQYEVIVSFLSRWSLVVSSVESESEISSSGGTIDLPFRSADTGIFMS